MSRRIRRYTPGDPPPPANAGRYKSAQGYMRLRWRGPDGHLYECYEHRWIMQCFDPALQVHHKNRIRSDNRPENLEVLTESEHQSEHRVHDWDQVVDLYRNGLSSLEIRDALGVDPSQVSRILSRCGVPARSTTEALEFKLDDEAIADLYAAGASTRELARLFGVSQWAIERRLHRSGVETRRGRRADHVAEAGRAALDAFIQSGDMAWMT